MILCSPTKNEIALTLALSPFDNAQGRRWNGRGDFSIPQSTRYRSLFLPSPACGRGKGEGEWKIPGERFLESARNDNPSHLERTDRCFSSAVSRAANPRIDSNDLSCHGERKRRICFFSTDREKSRFFVARLLRMTQVVSARDLRLEAKILTLSAHSALRERDLG
jgi:hypothetical protein